MGRFSKKKTNKSQQVATWFLIEFCRANRVGRVMTFPIFSSTRPGSSPESAGLTRRVGPGFKTIL
jgi:hypothetical protein